VISITDDFCGGAILDIDPVSVLGVVSCWGSWCGLFAFALFDFRRGIAKLPSKNCQSCGIVAICSQPDTPNNGLMPVKAVEAMERLGHFSSSRAIF